MKTHFLLFAALVAAGCAKPESELIRAFPTESRQVLEPAPTSGRLRIPASNGAPTQLVSPNATVGVRLEESPSGRPTIEQGVVIQPWARATSFFKEVPGGFEEWVFFKDEAPAELRWEISGASLDARDGIVDVKTASGLHAFTVTAPHATDARGQLPVLLTSRGNLLVLQPLRPVVPPVLFDPVWTATSGQPQVARVGAVAFTLADGRVLVCGGALTDGGVTAETEVYNPASDTWSTTANMLTARSGFSANAVAIDRDTVVVAGGQDSTGATLLSVEAYVADAGAWVALPDLLQPRASFSLVKTSGYVGVAVGGASAAAATADAPTEDGGRVLIPLGESRTQPGAVLLDDGRLFVVGGINPADGGAYATTRLVDLDAGAVVAGPSMSVGRYGHTVTKLPNGDILVAGGYGSAAATAEVFQVSGQSWSSPINLRNPRTGHVASRLPNGDVILAGGFGTAAQKAERFNWVGQTLTYAGCLVTPRAMAAATTLLDGGVLLVHGQGLDGGVLNSSELFTPQSGLGLGASCANDCQCSSGFCADGVCCNSACNRGCEACSAAKGASIDGTCTTASLGTSCRAATGLCDRAETCSGSSPSCPADSLVDAGAPCRPAAGACDVAETCSGASVNCPADTVVDAGTACRTSSGTCDLADTCNGVSTSCADLFVDAGVECRASAGACDSAEVCTGNSATCPTDVLSASGVVCRAAAGACDVAESCNGTTGTCPADAVKAAATVCRPSVGPCDVDEACDGTAASCPADAVKPSGTLCRASAGLCDEAETCNGTVASCPTNAFMPTGTVCRATAGACDVPEVCGGTADCPSDALATAGTACTNGLVCAGNVATCPQMCTRDADCVAGDACVSGACTPVAMADAGTPASQRRFIGWSCAAGGNETAWYGVLAFAFIQIVRSRKNRKIQAPLVAAALCAAPVVMAEEPAPAAAVVDEGHRGMALRIHAAVVRDFLASAVGAEAGLAFGFASRFDINASASFGSQIGARLGVSWHLQDNGEWVRPFVQVRGLLYPTKDGLTFGGGGFAGAFVELFHGRALAGVAAEGYAAPPGYPAFGVYGVLGYEFDIYRGDNPVEVASAPVLAPAAAPVEAQKPPPVTLPPPPPVAVKPPKPPPPEFPAPATPAALFPAAKPAEAPATKPAETATKPLTPAPAPPAVAPAPDTKPADSSATVKTRVKVREVIGFDAKVVALNEYSKKPVEKLVKLLKRFPQVKKLQISGYADDGKDEKANLDLSKKRAEAVMKALLKDGIEKNRLTIKAWGSSAPADEGISPRRVDFQILEQDEIE